MRALLLVCVLVVAAAAASAKRNDLKPTDFEPLTSLPWKSEGATLDGVLDRFFRETNPAIRYPVLAAYLRLIPEEQLGEAFDICIRLEGTHSPDQLVGWFLRIWAERDPASCWERTRTLFRLVGIEAGWLGYDSWQRRERITVQDRDAIIAAGYWLRRDSLRSFPLGVDASSLPPEERVVFLKKFADMWFAAFRSWPGYEPDAWADGRGVHPRENTDVIEMLDKPPEHIRNTIGSRNRSEAAVEAGLRRWLQAEPEDAIKILDFARERHWSEEESAPNWSRGLPSIEFLMVWAEVDLPGLIRWAESLHFLKGDLALRVKGFLMSRVDEKRRKRWLAAARARPTDERAASKLLIAWAGWQPKAALDEAIATHDGENIYDVIEAGSRGPWGGRLYITTHSGLGWLKRLDAPSLIEQTSKVSEYGKPFFLDSWYILLEPWGDIDIGETARYGLDFLLRTDFAPRANLLKLFSGDDAFASDSDMIDRTFCALRVWAVVQPAEMRKWIATLDDADLEKALTWLLEHPWGGPGGDGPPAVSFAR